MKKLLISMLCVSTIFFVGCLPRVDRSPEKEAPAPVPLSALGQEGMQGRVETEKDSSREGVYEGVIEVRSRIELDPWAFVGDDAYEQKREACNQQILAGELNEDCPTNTVLYAKAPQGERLPKEIVSTKYAPADDDLEMLKLGCLGEEGWYAAPLRDSRISLNAIISLNDQELLIASANSDIPVKVRITKRAYDIPGRGGTACDIHFSRLQIVK